MSFAAGVPIDSTNGTGVFPAGGVVTIPANTARQWLYIQSRDVGEVTVTYDAVRADTGAATTITVALDPAKASGDQGGVEERDATVFMPARGNVTITGTAGQKVTAAWA